MLKRELIKAGIVCLIGIVTGIIYVNSGTIYESYDIILYPAFFAIWFLGIVYCMTPIKKWLSFYLGLGILGELLKRHDRYKIFTTFAGGLVFSIVVSVGWVFGLFKFIYYMVVAVRTDRVV